MRFGVMITNGPGGHPAWKHAEITADKLIVDPLPDAPDYAAKAEAAARLRRQVRDMMEAHHENVKQHEVTQLTKMGAGRMSHPLEPEAKHLDDAIADIVKLTKGTVLEAHYARPEVQAAMRHELAHEFRSQQHIHREEHRMMMAAAASKEGAH